PSLSARAAFGPRVGFAVVWMCFVNALFSFAAVASAAAAYAAPLLPSIASAIGPRAIAAGAIAVFAAINYVGAKPGALAVDAFTLAKFAVLVVLACALAPGTSAANLHAELPHGWSGVGSATFLAVLGAVHPRFGSPHVAIVATAAIAIALVASFDYRSLIGISNVAVAAQYLATCLAVPRLRQRGIAGKRVPGGWTVPLLGAAMSI